MRSGHLYNWCNADGDVTVVFNDAYRGLFLAFAILYIKDSHDIKTINILVNEVIESATKQGVRAYVEEFLQLTDDEGVEMIQISA